MQLLGQLANPSYFLEQTLAAPSPKPRPSSATSAASTTGRLGNGVVQRAALKVLAASDRPLRTGEVQAAIETLLGHPVAKESVSWSLRTGSRGESPRFERVAYATYRLRPTS